LAEALHGTARGNKAAGTSRGRKDCWCGSEERQRAVEQGHVARTRQGQRQQQQRRDHLADVASGQDEAAIDAIGDLAGRQREQRHRQEHRQPDIAERQRIAGDVVDLPAHGHGLHVHAQPREETAAEEQAQVADGEDVGGRRLGIGHANA
jgi:hypothetical protein